MSLFSRNTPIPEKYGDTNFISFFATVLSRLSYFNDNNFLKKYNAIMGPVILIKILTSINNVEPFFRPVQEISDKIYLDDLINNENKVYNLSEVKNNLSDYKYNYKTDTNPGIDYLELNMPQNINIIINEIKGTLDYPIPPRINTHSHSSSVKYISISWSNYGEVYVVADKKMPNTIFLIFRGTYSAKTASLYLKPTSFSPREVGISDNEERFLYGIFKPTIEMMHTIIETMCYLVNNFLGASDANSVKIFTTGHSLGGAMCTNFSYLWMGIKQMNPYNTAPYNVLADNIICISIGAPRCMSLKVARTFCDFCEGSNGKPKKILYLRITSRGDPVPALPPKYFGFEHPCSSIESNRKKISEDCNSDKFPLIPLNIDYTVNLNCSNKKTEYQHSMNPLNHTSYLHISFLFGVDLLIFFKGTLIQTEIQRMQNGSTVCRLIMGNNDEYKVCFFNVNDARNIPNNIDKKEAEENDQLAQDFLAQIPTDETNEPNLFSHFMVWAYMSSSFLQSITNTNNTIAEDVRMTNNAFLKLIEQMVPMELAGDLNPLYGTISKPFTTNEMPKIINILTYPIFKGGKNRHTRKHRHTRKSSHTRKSRKIRKSSHTRKNYRR